MKSPQEEEHNPAELFSRWIIQPLEKLRSIPNGDGAFIALGAAFSLYERYVKSSLAQLGQAEGPDEFRRFAATDLGIKEELFNRFWGSYRDGIQHSLQPKRYTSGKIRYGWEVGDAHGALPTLFAPSADLRIVCINPWKFIDLVLVRYQSRPDLIDFKDSWKFGVIKSSSILMEGQAEITMSAQPHAGDSQALTVCDVKTGISPEAP